MTNLAARVKRVPHGCVWEITTACNLRCVHCEVCAGTSRVDELDTAAMLQLADDLAALGCRKAHLSGGEVLLRKDLFEIIEQAVSLGIKTNLTLNFNASQALLAAKVGASYISPFVGRLDYINQVGMDLVRQIKQIYYNYGYETEIIVAAIRHPEHVLQSALIGADICTMRFDIMKMLYDHPLTDQGLEMFLKDWEKVPK